MTGLYHPTAEQQEQVTAVIEKILQQLLEFRGGKLTNLIRNDWSIDFSGKELALLNLSLCPVWITEEQAAELLDALRPKAEVD